MDYAKIKAGMAKAGVPVSEGSSFTLDDHRHFVHFAGLRLGLNSAKARMALAYPAILENCAAHMNALHFFHTGELLEAPVQEQLEAPVVQEGEQPSEAPNNPEVIEQPPVETDVPPADDTPVGTETDLVDNADADNTAANPETETAPQDEAPEQDATETDSENTATTEGSEDQTGE